VRDVGVLSGDVSARAGVGFIRLCGADVGTGNDWTERSEKDLVAWQMRSRSAGKQVKVAALEFWSKS
jgi:hypothetical protein